MERTIKSIVPRLSTEIRGRLAIGKGVIEFSRRKPLGAAGGVTMAALILVAVLAPLIAPFDPEEAHIELIHSGPSMELALGGDQLGRDILSRLFYGARISLFVGLLSVGIGISLGSLLGVVSAYFGGKFDLIVQRVVDSLLAFPAIILALALMAVLGSSVTNIIIALCIVLAPGSIRTVRSQALSIKEMDYVLAARAIGSSDFRIILRHMVPNCFAIFIILATITLGFAIIVESSLSFLGVGVPPNVPTWGGMLADAAVSDIQTAPWLSIFPGIAISLAVFGVNLLGDAMRDVLDPRLRAG
jgi:peptide/nickel transport system permease protein